MRLLLAASLALFLSACAATPVEDTPDARGTIAQVVPATEGSILGTLLVDRNPAEHPGSSRDAIAVSESTLILRRTGQGVVAAGFPDLRGGQRVAAWTGGTVLESYPRTGPRQVQATRLEILAD